MRCPVCNSTDETITAEGWRCSGCGDEERSRLREEGIQLRRAIEKRTAAMTRGPFGPPPPCPSCEARCDECGGRGFTLTEGPNACEADGCLAGGVFTRLSARLAKAEEVIRRQLAAIEGDWTTSPTTDELRAALAPEEGR